MPLRNLDDEGEGVPGAQEAGVLAVLGQLDVVLHGAGEHGLDPGQCQPLGLLIGRIQVRRAVGALSSRCRLLLRSA